MHYFKKKTIASNETFILEILLNKHNIKKECEVKQEIFCADFEKTLKRYNIGNVELRWSAEKI